MSRKNRKKGKKDKEGEDQARPERPDLGQTNSDQGRTKTDQRQTKTDPSQTKTAHKPVEEPPTIFDEKVESEPTPKQPDEPRLSFDNTIPIEVSIPYEIIFPSDANYQFEISFPQSVTIDGRGTPVDEKFIAQMFAQAQGQPGQSQSNAEKKAQIRAQADNMFARMRAKSKAQIEKMQTDQSEAQAQLGAQAGAKAAALSHAQDMFEKAHADAQAKVKEWFENHVKTQDAQDQARAREMFEVESKTRDIYATLSKLQVKESFDQEAKAEADKLFAAQSKEKEMFVAQAVAEEKEYLARGRHRGNGRSGGESTRGFAGRGAQNPHYRENDSDGGNRGERNSWTYNRPGEREAQPSYGNHHSRDLTQNKGPFPRNSGGFNYYGQEPHPPDQGQLCTCGDFEKGPGKPGSGKCDFAGGKDVPGPSGDQAYHPYYNYVDAGDSWFYADEREARGGDSYLNFSYPEVNQTRKEVSQIEKRPSGQLDLERPKASISMADEKSGELSHKGYFTVGSHISCRYQGGEVEGEVAAFHNTSRLLVIRSTATNGKPSANDIYVINADCVEKLRIHGPTNTDNLKPIDFHKLDKRRQKTIGLKKARIRALSADVAPEGRKLFLAITKTIDEVAWEGENIVVLNEVKISPPYKVEDVEGDKEASVVHVKKIVDKHWKENPTTN